MSTLRTVTLGCKVNQYETEWVRQGLTNSGYRDAREDEAADLCLVNTCTVTAEGDSKSRQAIRQLARRNPNARIIVMGCYATRDPGEVARLPNVAEVVTDKRELPDLMSRLGVVEVPQGLSRFDGRQRAYVKVQDGCMLHCSFCIIPQVRPHLVSRPPDHILDEIERLVAHGFHEIVLTGIHLGHYGIEQNQGKPKADWLRLSSLLARIAGLEGDFRVRLSSIEATEVTRELIAVMAAHPERICPHLHISLQSGSDSVLRRMRRRWGARRFVDRCRLFQESVELPAITTDIIVGFPGETEAEFMETCAVAREVPFSKIHVFPFSARRGTPAAEMPGQIAEGEKGERAERLKELDAVLRREYHTRLIGRRLRVLVEGTFPHQPDLAGGTSCRFAFVQFRDHGFQRRQLVDVLATGIAGDNLCGAAVVPEAHENLANASRPSIHSQAQTSRVND
ncbi:MAG TPA: tRNA (N(6)-L-threonylcarbamoyladenosine(37)-C(2))-methylthiotransferase MtaB [Pirellulales bacterium]|jgi:threonylcarbamoyladenosine tRNA methylthiotransferase MtaB|nr:tRNA (N(6)-L-threonylcarbamoyladenosine(37)-C(2))-methylthiotransferase MtaB [Pirellulales bacterium]